ncbi:MAG: YibE/F family protein [Candidatus Wallbacteria bacterium]|nr:YibE/F family protein [Candidatus Wallbacteria bacterium]
MRQKINLLRQYESMRHAILRKMRFLNRGTVDFALIFILLAALTMVSTLFSAEDTYLTGQVVETKRYTDEAGLLWENTRFEVKNGPLKGQHSSREPIEGQSALFPQLKPGDKVVLIAMEGPDGIEVHVVEPKRSGAVAAVLLLFSVLLVLLGRRKGVCALLSLAVTGWMIVYLFVPAVARGENPLAWAVVICAASTIVTILLVAGWTAKSAAAILGTIGGIIISAVVSLFFGYWMKLTGTADEAVYYLVFSRVGGLNFLGILHAGIIIGSLGAVMDVAMSLSSAAYELRKQHGKTSSGKIFRSLMNIGRDITGTMANTLVLAYAGGSLALFLLIYLQPDMIFVKLWNMEFIAAEVLRAAAGSIGILAAVPTTALSAALIIGHSSGLSHKFV